MVIVIPDHIDAFVTQASASQLAAIEKFYTLYPVLLGKRFMGMDPDNPPVIKFFQSSNGRINLQLLPDLLAFLDKKEWPYQIQDDRPPPRYNTLPVEEIGTDFLAGITLEEYQMRCIRAGLTNDFGAIDAATGAGKTEVIAALCKARPGCPTVILSEQRIVVDQIRDRLKLRDVEDAGVFYAGETPDGQSIVVASVQSSLKINKVRVKSPTLGQFEGDAVKYGKALVRYQRMLEGFKSRNRRAEKLRDIIRAAEMLIVDECDLATSPMYRSIFRHFFKGRWRYGLTGSVFDKGKKIESMRMRSYLGPVIARVSRHEVEAAGRIVPIKYRMVVVTGQPGDIHDNARLDIAVTEKMAQNPKFHRIVARLCAKHQGQKTLILVENVAVGDALCAAVPGAVFIHGKTPKGKRRKVLAAFEADEFSVLIGGKILKRGLDLKGGCDVLILAGGGQLTSDLKQKIGRGFRLNSVGYTLVYDFMLRLNKYLYRHSRTRLKAMVGLGFETRVIYPNGFVIDGADLIRRNFNVGRNWTAAIPV
jgi:superfamily II DNA or RNA helicase